MLKNFADIKIIRNFAVTNLQKSGHVRLLIAGFFYACTLQIYGVTPVKNCNDFSSRFSGISQRVGSAVFSVTKANFTND